ncbi:hypothetical protein BGZ70_002617 [Mortierella alpina]|uniref:F-box domain-containing protein n=1 Tax=Mortierella alpina TaxID=64518 RepID=A0A9P6JB94_MORAP|nr:hypothetical protein BGZ70_002617 [Mortierella alpina]
MDTLPLEAFQLICSFCSLHVLAQLRLVSRSFHDRVDGSLTARRTHAVPTKMITLKGKHDRDACYIRFTLFRQEDPITVVFNQYNPQHNYLEFVQRSEPVVVKESGRPVYASAPVPETTASATAAGLYPDYALGKLDLNLWEQQRELVTAPSLPPRAAGVEHASPSTDSRPRRSSITQASIIRGTENEIEQELASSGPVTPLARVRPTRHHGTSALGTSSSGSSSGFSALLGASTPREAGGEGENHMMRFARMVLGFTGTGSNNSQTRPGMSAAELAQEAHRLIHTVEPEVLSSQKLYKFYFSEGVHYVGDSDFVMRYTVTVGPLPSRDQPTTAPKGDLASTTEQDEESAPVQHYQLLQVDYIRVSWKWITSGMPSNVQAKQAGSSNPEDLEDASVKCSPLPNLRIGRIYAARFNRILQEIKDKGISQHVRAELAMQGYDVSILPRDFISVNLFADPVLTWITKDERTINGVPIRRGRGDRTEAVRGEGSADKSSDGSELDSDWEDLAPGETQSRSNNQGEGKGKDRADGFENEDHFEDQKQLDDLMQTLRDNVGLLTARNILEEMLATRGYSRELIWKYGIVRREMMGIVPEPTQAKQLLQKIIESESPSSRSWK